MCHLCGKCKKVGIPYGDCMVVPKYTWVPGPNGGHLRKTTKKEKIFKKLLTKWAIFVNIII